MRNITRKNLEKNQYVFEKLYKIGHKIVNFSKQYKFIEDKHTQMIKELLTKEEKELLRDFYNYYKEEIEDFNLNSFKNKRWERNAFTKTILALKQHMYIKDYRTILELYDNVLEGWENEDKIILLYLKLGLKVINNGKDANRLFSLFSFNSTPDLEINGIKVEVQTGDNPFFKANKLKTNVEGNGYILFKQKETGLYYLFDVDELKEISKNDSESYGKKGHSFEFSNYNFTTFEEANQKLLNIIELNSKS